MPRFTILEHNHPWLHWDLLLEAGAALRTWRLAQPPQTAVRIAATQLPDHRLLYLDYEGPVSGDRGVVRAWDRGVFALAVPNEAPRGTDWQSVLPETGGYLTLRLCGQRINGHALLVHQEGATWTFELSAADPDLNSPPASSSADTPGR